MQPKTANIPHIGRKIERLRTFKGVKQENLAAMIGVQQSTMSKIEKSEKVEPKRLQSIADALGLTVEAIENFDENAIFGTSNFFNPHFQDHAINVVNQFNPIEKIVELYERLLESERKKNDSLEARLQKLESGK